MSSRPRSAALVCLAIGLLAASVRAFLADREQPGETPDGATIVTTNQRVTPAGEVVLLSGERPKDLAISPDGRTVAVVTHRSLRLFTIEGEPVRSIALTPGPLGVAWAPDGGAIYVSGASSVFRVAPPATGEPYALGVEQPGATRPPGVPASPQPAGLAVSPDGRRLYVALGTRNALAVLDLSARQVVATVPTGVCPYHVALAPDGGTLIVSNQGGPRVTRSARTADSAGTPVRVSRATDAALRGSITLIDTRSLAARELLVGRHPAGAVFSADGRTATVANASDDSLSVVDTVACRVRRTISLRPAEDPGFGQMPTDIAARDDGRSLWVACGGANAIALVDPSAKEPMRGLVPAAWYPIALASRGDRLVVASAKGTGSRARRANGAFGVHDSVGVLQFLRAGDVRDLPALTRQVAANNRWGRELPPRKGVAPLPVPERVGEPSVFRHVVYIIKENHTYDVTLGDMPEGNGDPSLCLFGQEVTPNQHALARQWVLLDNAYTSGTNSADGHQWVASCVANAYMEQNYASYARSYPYDGGDPLAYSPEGFLWNAAARRRASVRVYGEFVNRPEIVDTGRPAAEDLGGRGADRGTLSPASRRAPTWSELWADYRSGGRRFAIRARTDLAALRPHLHPRFIGFPSIVSDQWRADQFLADLRDWERTGRMPALCMLLLPNNHTAGTTPGMPTPRAAVADNDLALGRIVEALSKSRFWKETLILVIEDDSQLGLDHVDGHRTIAFCVSPYTRRGAVLSRMFNHTSFLRTIELVLGIPAMNRFDRSAMPLTECFTETPDFRPFTHVPARIRLDELNPPRAALRGEARRWADASARQNWTGVDRAEPLPVARAVWHASRPGEPFPWHAWRPVEDDDD